MTGGSGLIEVLHRHRVALAHQIDKLVPLLVAKGVISGSEAAHILDAEEAFNNDNNNNNSNNKKSDKVDERGIHLVRVIASKGIKAQRELCNALQIISPELLTTLLLDNNSLDGSHHSRESSSHSGRDPSGKCNNRELELHRTASGSLASGGGSKRSDNGLISNGLKECELVRVTSMHELLEEPVEESLSERVSWEFHHVQLHRVRGYGFGIAVSGGRDNPHFTNGDPSIAISDVLHSGPAEGKLVINDRIVSANGIPLDGVDYATAVQVLRDSGQTVSLVVKRRVINHTLNTNQISNQVSSPSAIANVGSGSHHVRLHRDNRRVDFGLVVECKFFIKELTPHSVAAKENSLEKGDLVHKINNVSLDTLSLKEVKKLMDKADNKLEVVVKRNTRYHRQKVTENELRRLESSALVSPSRPPPVIDEAEEFTRIQRLSNSNSEQGHSKNIPDPRFIRFEKSGSVGIRLTGGNEVGIFVTAVQPGSPASQQGLMPGDKILKVNDMDMKGVTREEAVLFLLSLEDHINIIAQMRKDDYEHIVATQRGDSFYIKTHFNYETVEKGEMPFRSSDVFHVVDTLHNGVVGSWQVFKMDPFLSAMGRAAEQFEKGVIPNSTRAEEIAIRQFNDAKKLQQSTSTQQSGSSKGASAFFRRRRDKQARRSKSLGKDHWEDVVWSESVSKFPAYERVVLRHPNFARPLLIFGPVADLAREKLINEFPTKYAAPQQDAVSESGIRSGIVRLSAIRGIMSKGKHALLDVTPNAVDKLNYAQLYPIVVFCHTNNKAVVKECRTGLPKKAHLSSRKLLDQCQKLDRLWRHIFTVSIDLHADTWYDKLKEAVAQQQGSPIWMSENKPSESALADDFLFPMSSHCRLSYASSPESDGEALEPDTLTMGRSRPTTTSSATNMAAGSSTTTTTTPTTSLTTTSTMAMATAMARSTSDPNLVKEQQQKKLLMLSQQHQQVHQETQGEDVEEVNDIPNYHLTPPFAISNNKLTVAKTSAISEPAAISEPLSMSKPLSAQRSPHDQPLPHVPPRIDRQKKPSSQNGDKAKMLTYNGHEDLLKVDELHQRTQVSRRRQTLASHHFANVEHSSFNVSNNNNNNNNSNMGNTNVNTGNTNGNSGNEHRYAAEIRYSDYKPVPPPKSLASSSSSYKPVPPPKPKSYPRSTSTPSSHYPMSSSMTMDENNYMNSGVKQLEEENGFDSGQGSSLDRDMAVNGDSPKSGSRDVGRKQFYFNINESNGYTRRHTSTKSNNNGLDLSNREYRGSAFELYRKPIGQHYHNMTSLPPR